MIQRIQTLYLAIAAALAGILLNGNIVTLVGKSGELYKLSFRGISVITNGSTELIEKSLPLTIIMFVVPVLLFIAILLFKNRKLQIRVTVFSTLLYAGVLIMMIYYIIIAGKNMGADPIFNIKLVFPLAGIIFGYLAFRAILKDELLIKSYDRIR